VHVILHDEGVSALDHMQSEKEKAIEFLMHNDVAVVATTSPVGEPQAAALYYIAESAKILYFVTGSNTKKFQNLRENARVAFVVGSGSEPVTLQGGGIAEVIHGGRKDEILDKFKKIVERERSWPILEVLSPGFIEVFCVHVSWLSWLDHRGKNAPQDFIQILP